MDMVLQICVSDGSEIVIDGFDDISFSNEYPNHVVEHNGYSWQRDFYNDLMNYLNEFNFITITRKDPKDDLYFHNHAFAFQNQHTTVNQPLTLKTNNVITIIDLYK
ncbi:hypothetical protein AQ616_19010 [Oceanobacillus sp. E9]|uniref:hypothetical protein n=1 Tax=Oceanobacillus sp. E9 TaxID=1742575 RepID=UPI00084EA82D|nr:hypothetical protein [Oceanobacillus sp. E9]OEH55928.1 hypothetical protein AQ616_19010 [Oceanobacillus sp. E9]